MSEESTSDLPAGPPVPATRLLALAVPQAGVLSVATLALMISSGLTLVYPRVVAMMVDQIGGKPAPVPYLGELSFDQMALAMFVLFAVSAVFSMVRSWLFTIAGERVVAKLRTDLYAAILHQEIAFFDRSRTGELTNRLASDTTVLQNTVTVNVSMALRFGASAVGGMAMLVWTSPRLATVTLVTVPAVAVAAAVYGRLVRRWSRDVQDALADATTVAEETFAGVRTVRAFARESTEVARYDEAVERSYLLAAKRALAVGIFNGFIGFAGYGTIAVVVWYGGSLVLDDLLSAGDLTAFLLYTLMVAFSFSALANLFGDFMRASGASQRVFNLLDEAKATVRGGDELVEPKGAVRFEQVRFAYPTRPDIVVLDAFDLDLRPGRSVALVGPSGSGKSTVAQLLSRFYQVSEGRVVVDGRDVTELDGKSLRRHIGVVAQEPILFATSIAENIRYGRLEATDEEVRQAAAAANALSFVDEFPEGFDTMVGERGVRLSGGQKQRIAIARAVLKDPAILVLDEATSALDSESEHLVQEALDRLMDGRTTLVIAHRLSTVRDADEVVVLEGGRAVERGSHDDLVEQGGLYKRLVERQFASGS